MINYFKELLATIKSIDASLKTLNSNCDKVIIKSSKQHGDRYSLSTKHWND